MEIFASKSGVNPWGEVINQHSTTGSLWGEKAVVANLAYILAGSLACSQVPRSLDARAGAGGVQLAAATGG